MSKKAWIVFDARYHHDPDSANVLETFVEQEHRPSNKYLRDEWGGMEAVLVEYDVSYEAGRHVLINPRPVEVIQ